MTGYRPLTLDQICDMITEEVIDFLKAWPFQPYI